MKTLKEWLSSDIELQEYLVEPCEVDEDIIADQCYYVGSINDFENNITQVNEAYDSNEDGELIYTTFVEKDKKLYYLGHFMDCSENDISYVLENIENIKEK